MIKNRRWLFVVALIAACLTTVPGAIAQDLFGSPGFGAAEGGEPRRLKVSAQFTVAAAGQPARLYITAEMEPGWHITSLTQKEPYLPTKIKVAESRDYRLQGPFQSDPQPHKKTEVDGSLSEVHEGVVTWFAPLELAPGVDPKMLGISGKINVQACGPQGCEMPRDYSFVARLGPGLPVASASVAPPAPRGESAPPSPPKPRPAKESKGLIDGRPNWYPIQNMEQLKSAVPGLNVRAVQDHLRGGMGGASLRDILVGLLGGFLGGLILNIMPCVLPVIGLKLLSFVEQSGHNRFRSFMLNVYYSAGLLAVFAVLGGLAVGFGFGWGQLFRYQTFNISLSAVVFVMALSLLGVWELPIPGFVGSGKAAELAAKEGAAGAFFKGALSTLLATPCSAPFLGTAVAWGMIQPPLLTFAVFLSAGLGMASPYLLVGAFPGLLRFIPKPGAWMETFKHIMGFLLLGTVWFILFSSVSIPNLVATVGFLFGLWPACWWIGRTSVLASTYAKFRAWLQSLAFAGAIWIVMFPGTSGILPDWFAFRGVAAHMRGQQTEVVASDFPRQQPLTRKTVVVLFTADWCTTCKTLEAAYLYSAQVKSAIAESGAWTFEADYTHIENSKGVDEMLEMLLAKQVPVVAIFPAREPNRPIVFRGTYTGDQLVAALKAVDNAGN